MKITKSFLAISLASILLFNFIPVNTFAEDSGPADRVSTTSELPEGVSLTATDPDHIDSEYAYNFVYESETAYEELQELQSQEDCDESEETMAQCNKNVFENFYDKYGLVFFYDILDIHLANSQNLEDEIDYEGDDIEITMKVHVDYERIATQFLEVYSNLKWKPMMLHANPRERTIEYLPVTIDGQYWTFTTNKFSLFSPVAVAIEEEPEAEPVKTLDSSIYYIGLVAVSLATIATYSVYLKKSMR